MLAHAEWTVDLNRVEVTPLYEEFSSIVAAPRHRLALKRAPTWAEAANERWVLPPHRTPLRPKLDRMLSVHRRPGGPHPADIQADSAPLALHLVRSSGLLWATANHYAEDFERRGLVRRIAMPGELLRGPMCAFRLRSEAMNTPTRVFLQCMQDAAAAPLPSD
ncbi:LysR substrate binding domain protein [compost metagenome]